MTTTLVYHTKLGLSGYAEFARRNDGQWLRRHHSTTRNGSFRKPGDCPQPQAMGRRR
jgi:hypothetical protein